MRGISWLSEELLASQEGFYFMDFAEISITYQFDHETSKWSFPWAAHRKLWYNLWICITTALLLAGRSENITCLRKNTIIQRELIINNWHLLLKHQEQRHAQVISIQGKKKTLTYKPPGRAVKDASYQAGTKNSQISCLQANRPSDLVITVHHHDDNILQLRVLLALPACLLQIRWSCKIPWRTCYWCHSHQGPTTKLLQ